MHEARKQPIKLGTKNNGFKTSRNSSRWFLLMFCRKKNLALFRYKSFKPRYKDVFVCILCVNYLLKETVDIISNDSPIVWVACSVLNGTLSIRSKDTSPSAHKVGKNVSRDGWRIYRKSMIFEKFVKSFSRSSQYTLRTLIHTQWSAVLWLMYCEF